MALSWIKRAKRPLSVDDLVGAGEYRKAIELLRKQFSQRYPSTTERQGYAELLVRAGRGAEAVPVLLGIADEQERYGFPDKALEALRCAAVIDPEQAEVKERLEALPAAPAPAPAVAPPLEKEAEPEASDTWGAALDGAFRVEGELQESVEGAEEVPAGVEAEAGVALDDAPEFAVLDADDPDPVRPIEREDTVPSGDGRELVVVEDEGEITATSIPVEPSVLGADESEPAASADDGEITATSIRVDPSVLGDPEDAAVGADDGEITATSIRVDPSVLGDPEDAAVGADDGEITATSIRVEPSVLGADGHGTGPDDGEITATSIRVEPSVLGAAELESAGADADVPEVAATDLVPAPDLLLPEEDLEPEEVEELTAEDELEPAPFHTGESPDPDTETDAGALLPGSAPDGDELRSLLTDEDLDAALAADAEALLSGGPTEDEAGPPEDEDHLHELFTADARALLAEHPSSDSAGALADLVQLDELLATDARALLSDSPTPDRRTPVAAAGSAPQAPAGGTPDLPAANPESAGPAPSPVYESLADDVRAPFSVAPAPSGAGAPVTAGGLDAELAADARALLGQSPGDDGPEPPVAAAGPDRPPAAEAPDLPPAGHPDETHLFLSEDDLLGAFAGGPEPALRKTAELAARATASVEEGAEGTGEEQRDHLAG